MPKKTRNKILAALILGSLVTMPVLEARLRRISIGTNPVGTIYFVVGGGIAKLFTKELRVPARPVPHAGSSVYLTLLDRGELTLGLNTSLDSALAYRGRAPYKRALAVEALARVFVMPYGYFVKARSGIETMADLKGKRVVVDLKGNASLAALNWAMLETAGLGKNDITPVAVGGIEQGVAAVTEGRADAAPIAMGIPLLRRAHTSIPGGVRVIALGPQATDDLLNELAPGSRTHRLEPSSQYVGVSQPTIVSAFDTFINVGSHVEEEDAYLLVKTLHENWAGLQDDYPALSDLSAEGLDPPTNPHPYAAGAVRYYKEAELWSEANEAQQIKAKR